MAKQLDQLWNQLLAEREERKASEQRVLLYREQLRAETPPPPTKYVKSERKSNASQISSSTAADALPSYSSSPDS